MKISLPSTISSENCENVTQFSSVVDLIRHRAVTQALDTAYIFLKDGEVESSKLTYQELDQHARAIAVHLREYVKPGDRVAIAFPPGLDFITAFSGCIYAGVVAVPVYPPSRLNDWVRFEKIVIDAGVQMVLTNTATIGGARLASTSVTSGADNNIKYLATENMALSRADEWEDPRTTLSDFAFLQYTSGSTGAPKGVIVSHGNLLHNQRIIKKGFNHTNQTISVGWLPLYHDMGLIGNVFQSLYLGTPSILMAPAAFIVKPVRWLEAISKYRATTSGGPNFAYELCVRRVSEEQREMLDLSSWEIAFNGSEMIREETLTRFCETFSTCGFKRSSFFCCYGLAESTLFVAGGKSNSGWNFITLNIDALQHNQVVLSNITTENPANFVSSGSPVELQVSIIDPSSFLACSPETIGEIWIKGDSVAQGYWNNSQVSASTFSAHLADTGEGPFMRTGDLGFMRDNQLYVTGRLKDLIIIRGRNYYSHDIENAVQASHPSLRVDGGAAFSIDVNGFESLVVVHEVNRTHSRNIDIEEVTGAVHAAMTMELGLRLHDFVLLKQGGILKTSSGKTRRSACRDAYLAGTLQVFKKTSESILEVKDA